MIKVFPFCLDSEERFSSIFRGRRRGGGDSQEGSNTFSSIFREAQKKRAASAAPNPVIDSFTDALVESAKESIGSRESSFSVSLEDNSQNQGGDSTDFFRPKNLH